MDPGDHPLEGCPCQTQNSGCDGFYHSRAPPANDARATTRKSFRIVNSPRLGTDGKGDRIPLLGEDASNPDERTSRIRIRLLRGLTLAIYLSANRLARPAPRPRIPPTKPSVDRLFRFAGVSAVAEHGKDPAWWTYPRTSISWPARPLRRPRSSPRSQVVVVVAASMPRFLSRAVLAAGRPCTSPQVPDCTQAGSFTVGTAMGGEPQMSRTSPSLRLRLAAIIVGDVCRCSRR